jgi:hypothetical protein
LAAGAESKNYSAGFDAPIMARLSGETPRHFSYRDAGNPAQIGQRKAGIDFGAIKPRG